MPFWDGYLIVCQIRRQGNRGRLFGKSHLYGSFFKSGNRDKADFICCNIYDLKERLNATFDIVYFQRCSLLAADLKAETSPISLNPADFSIFGKAPLLFVFDNSEKATDFT
jgi:hypothetical protein